MKDYTAARDIEAIWDQIRTFSRERDTGFEDLMPYRIRTILLVASAYDSFTLEEGGRLTELILTEYRDLSLSQAPLVTRAISGEDGLSLIREREFDLVITMTRIGDMDFAEFARRTKELRPDLSVIALAYNTVELEPLVETPDSPFDRTFIWTGDVRLLVAII